MPGNLLVDPGRLSAVIEVGGFRHPDARRAFRAALDVDDGEWDRGKGWAFAQAIGYVHCHRATNPVMSETAAGRWSAS